MERGICRHPLLHVVGGHDSQVVNATTVIVRIERLDGEINLDRNLPLFFLVLGV